MTDADMTQPSADDHPKDPDHAPATTPGPAGQGEAPSAEEQGDHETAEVEQTGGKVANPYMD